MQETNPLKIFFLILAGFHNSCETTKVLEILLRFQTFYIINKDREGYEQVYNNW